MSDVNSNKLEYKICNFEIPRENIELGEYRFERVANYEEKISKLYKTAKWDIINKVHIPEQEGSHQVTCIATAKQEEKDSVLLLGGKGIKDTLLLYNFLARRSSCIYEDRSVTDHRFDEVGIKFNKERIFDLIKIALPTIRKPNWFGKNQDSIFPFHWLMQSRVPRVFEVSYVSRWVAFEVLWKSEILKEKFKTTLNDYIKKIDKNFKIKFYERFWANIRHCIVHQGTCNFNNFSNQFNEPRSGLKRPHKDFFNQHVNQNNFSEFKHSSRYVLDSLLTIFFAKIFGIKNINSYIDSNETEWIKNYFQSLKIPNLTEQ